MNIYVVPFFDGGRCFIHKVIANSINDAQDKIISQLSRDYDLEYIDSWEEFCEQLYQEGMCIGEIEDIETI